MFASQTVRSERESALTSLARESPWAGKIKRRCPPGGAGEAEPGASVRHRGPACQGPSLPASGPSTDGGWTSSPPPATRTPWAGNCGTPAVPSLTHTHAPLPVHLTTGWSSVQSDGGARRRRDRSEGNSLPSWAEPCAERSAQATPFPARGSPWGGSRLSPFWGVEQTTGTAP